MRGLEREAEIGRKLQAVWDRQCEIRHKCELPFSMELAQTSLYNLSRGAAFASRHPVTRRALADCMLLLMLTAYEAGVSLDSMLEECKGELSHQEEQCRGGEEIDGRRWKGLMERTIKAIELRRRFGRLP